MPRRKHHQGDANPAPTVHHADVKCVESRHGQKRPTHGHEAAAGHYRERPDGKDRQPLRFYCQWVLAGHTEGESRRGTPQEIGHSHHSPNGQDGERRLAEQHLAKKRYFAEDRDLYRFKWGDLGWGGDVRQKHPEGKGRKGSGQHGDTQPRHMLGKAEMDREQGMQQSEHRSHEGGEQYPRPEVSSEIDPDPAGHAAGGHDPFDAEVEDTGAFTDQFTEGAEDKRCRHSNCCGPESRLEYELNNIHDLYFHLIRYLVNNMLNSTARSETAVATSAI